MRVEKKKVLLNATIYGLLSFIVAFVATFALSPFTQAKIDLKTEERDFIDRLNDYRKDQGLKKLKISKDLSEAAAAMAEDMAENPLTINQEHKDSKGRLPSERASLYGYTDGVGENLAAGYKSAKKVFDAWKDSTDHKENMIDSDYEVMGVARVVSDTNYKWYWVNMFGEEEHNSDLLTDREYKPFKSLKLEVTNEQGIALNKAKIRIMNKGGSVIESGRTGKNGKKTLTVEPRTEYYVKASLASYRAYTKRVKPEDENEVKVKIWLESE